MSEVNVSFGIHFNVKYVGRGPDGRHVVRVANEVGKELATLLIADHELEAKKEVPQSQDGK